MINLSPLTVETMGHINCAKFKFELVFNESSLAFLSCGTVPSLQYFTTPVSGLIFPVSINLFVSIVNCSCDVIIH